MKIQIKKRGFHNSMELESRNLNRDMDLVEGRTD